LSQGWHGSAQLLLRRILPLRTSPIMPRLPMVCPGDTTARIAMFANLDLALVDAIALHEAKYHHLV